jgi:HK97 family phage portal protein
MNWFTNLFETRKNPNATNEIIYSGGGTYLNVGKVNEERAMSIPAVSCAINLYAGVISSLPLEIHTFNIDTKNFVLDENNPLWDIISEFANDEMTAPDWLQFIVRRAFINGRSLTYVERDARGYVSNIYPLDNTKFDIRITADGSKRYVHRTTGKTFVPAEIIDLIWQLKGDTFGHVNPLKQHESFYYNALLAEQFANAVFQNGPMPPLVAYKKLNETSAARTTENTAKALKEAMSVARSTDGVVMLPDSLTLGEMPYDPSKSQVLETRKLITADAARIYNVPPSLLHDLSTGTFNNTEQAAQNFLKFCLQPWLTKIEKELNLKLLGRASPKSSFIKFNTDHLIRGSLKDFLSAYSTATDKGIMTRDEVRYLMNLPLKGGAASDLSMQKQFAPLEDSQTDENNNKNGDEPIND